MTDIDQTTDAYTEAKAAEETAGELRAKLTNATAGAVRHGLDKGWANTQLAALGAQTITGTSEYRMNIPVGGVYGWRCKATSRTEALAKFMEQVNRVREAGKITADGSYDNVYDLVIAADSAVTFYAGPEDVTADDAEPLTLADLKVRITGMLREGVMGYGWNYRYAQKALSDMGLDALPNVTTKQVKVPVSGFTTTSVMVFEGADDSDIQAAAAGALSRVGNVYMTPDEIGGVQVIEADREDDNDEVSDYSPY